MQYIIHNIYNTYMCEYRCLKRPGEGSLGAGPIGGCELYKWVLGTEYRSSPRAVHAPF